MVLAKLLRLNFEKRFDIYRPDGLHRESNLFEIGDESSYSPDLMDNHLRVVAQAFEVLLEPNHHGRCLVGRPLASLESQKAVDGPAADSAPIDQAVRPMWLSLAVESQGDPIEGFHILWLKIVYARVVGPEVIEKKARMQAVVEDRFVVDALVNEMLLVLVQFGILTRRRRPLPLNTA